MIPKAESIMIKPIIIACLCVSSLAMADDPISADRPGFSSGTYTVAPGRINAEFGYQYSANNHGIDQSTHTLPLMVLRAGFLSDMEIDLMWAGWNIDKVGEQSSTNSHSDLTVATKYRLHRGNDFNLTAFNRGCFVSQEDMQTKNEWWEKTKANLKPIPKDLKEALDVSPAGIKYGPR